MSVIEQLIVGEQAHVAREVDGRIMSVRGYVFKIHFISGGFSLVRRHTMRTDLIEGKVAATAFSRSLSVLTGCFWSDAAFRDALHWPSGIRVQPRVASSIGSDI